MKYALCTFLISILAIAIDLPGQSPAADEGMHDDSPQFPATTQSDRSPLLAGFVMRPLHYEIQHPYDLKLSDRASFDPITDTFDLWVLMTDKPHLGNGNRTNPRTEFRLLDSYKPNTGIHAMDCDLFIVPGTFACITQVFGTGPMCMILCQKDSSITQIGGKPVLGQNMTGKWFNWKVIHDTSKTGPGSIKVFIDNQLAGDLAAKYQRSYYFKVGLYSRTGGSRNEIKIRNLQYWIKPPASPATTGVSNQP